MRLKLYSKIFFATGVPFGVFFGLVCSVAGALIGSSPDVPFSTAQGAFFGFLFGSAGSGIPFGASMALILGTLHLANSDSPHVRHQRAILLDVDRDEAMRLCQEAIRKLKDVNPRATSPRRIEAKTGITWRTFGDLITCDIEPAETDTQKVVVQSRPRVRTTVVDYGSNLENVEAIVSYLVQSGGRLAS